MGLLMFREPDANTPSQPKHDPTAEARSSIRRSSRSNTTAFARAVRNGFAASPHPHSSRVNAWRRARAHRDSPRAVASGDLERYQDRYDETDDMRELPPLPPSLTPRPDDREGQAVYNHLRMRYRRPVDAVTPQLEDLSMPHAHPQTSTYVPPLRTASSAPPRRHEARLGDVRRGLERSNSGRYSPYRRQQPRSYSHEDSPAPVNPPIARRFAPAYRFGETENLPTERPDGNGPSSQSRNYLPPLRRNRHRVSDGQDDQPVPTLAEAQLDGLGDRRRSISPMENNWEMLFSTIPPDDRLPSAESSFTSASASARSLSSNGRASASTNPTVASLGDLIESSHVCPEPTDSSSSDTDEEDYPVGEFMDSQRVTVHHMHSHHHHHHHVDGPAENRSTSSGRQTPEDPEPISFPPGRTRPLPREDRQRRSDLQQMHDLRDILACLERQEPVPEEWWASAGLARNLGGSISRVQDRVERERL